MTLASLALGCKKIDLTAGEAIDLNQAREYSDGVVSDLLADRHKELRARMENTFQQSVSEADIPRTLEQLHDAYGGKPLEAEFKSHEVGERLYMDGSRKPLRKFWYAVRTTRAPMGTYYLIVEIVPEGSRLAAVQFSIASFANGAPAHLR